MSSTSSPTATTVRTGSQTSANQGPLWLPLMWSTGQLTRHAFFRVEPPRKQSRQVGVEERRGVSRCICSAAPGRCCSPSVRQSGPDHEGKNSSSAVPSPCASTGLHKSGVRRAKFARTRRGPEGVRSGSGCGRAPRRQGRVAGLCALSGANAGACAEVYCRPGGRDRLCSGESFGRMQPNPPSGESSF